MQIFLFTTFNFANVNYVLFIPELNLLKAAHGKTNVKILAPTHMRMIGKR